MTLVASFSVEKCPVLLGDILVTGADIPGRSAVLPTVGEVSTKDLKESESSTVPAGTRQKLAILGDNLALGWSGKVSTAEDVFARLKEMSEDRPWCRESLGDHFRNLSSSTWNEISIIGYISDDRGLGCVRFGQDVVSIPTSEFGEITAIGSGTRSFHSHRSSVTPSSFEAIRGPRSFPVFAKVLSQAFAMSGTLIGNELVSINSLKEGYGAGYECVVPFDQGFGKLGDCMFVYLVGTVHKDGFSLSQVPVAGLRLDYQGDLLVMRSFNPKEENVFSGNAFLVRPIYRELTRKEISGEGISLPSFNAHHQYIQIFIDTDFCSEQLALCIYDYVSSPEDQPSIRYSESKPYGEGTLEVAISNEFFQTIAAEVWQKAIPLILASDLN